MEAFKGVIENINLTIFLAIVFLIVLSFVLKRHLKSGKIENIKGEDFVKILEVMYGKGSSSQSLTQNPARPAQPSSVNESLLSFFESALVSRYVLRVLAISDKEMTIKEITTTVNFDLEKKQKTQLPEAAIDKVVRNLIGADLVALRDGDYGISETGVELNNIIQSRKKNNR